MPAQVGTAVSGTLAAIQRACLRLNPCMDLDVDLLAVSRAAACSSTADWTAQALSNLVVDSRSGAVTLAQTAAVSIFSQTVDHSVAHTFTDGQAGSANKGREEYAIDFFPSPSVYGGVPFSLKSLDVWLGTMSGPTGAMFTANDSVFRVQVAAYDARWRLVPLGDPIDIKAQDIITALGAFSGIYTIDLTQGGRRFVFESGNATTRTGPGLDSGGLARVVSIDPTGASTLVLARGLSISIVPMGTAFQAAAIGCAATGSLAAFDTTTFWRVAANRNMGPYDPAIVGYGGADVLHNPDDNLTTGAVPGYGAVTASDGVSTWGIARRVQVAQRGQDNANGWQRPYHVLKAQAYQSTGSATAVLDMGGVPVNAVQIRINDFQPTGTSITYTLSGSPDNTTWTSIGAVVDGQELTGANLYRYYKLVATFTPGPSGATKYATPSLLAWQMVERIVISTYRYLEQFDADATVDPVTGQSGVAELKLPILRGGVRNFRDMATMVNSQYAPASIEAHVFARNTVTGERLFLNSYRLENRNPTDGAEEMTFTGGMDLLTALVPPPVESYQYPTPGSAGAAITVLGGILATNPNPATGHLISIGVAGTPFIGETLTGFRYRGVTGLAAGYDYRITADTPRDTSGNALAAGSGFVIDTNIIGTGLPGPRPDLGDTFEIHSDVTSRGPVTYPGTDFAAVAADVLNIQSGVPARYRGQLPATTGRTSGAYTLPSAGTKASEVLAAVGLHCAGAFGWIGGRVSFFDIFSAGKVSVVTWDERHYTKLDTPLGADRRMPSIRAKYDYQSDTQKFAFEMKTDDADAVEGWGRANLFDTFDLPDSLCVWNDAAGTEAQFITNMFQNAFKSGVRIWDVETVLYYPWLNLGDAVTIMTDQYTDRRLHFAADGVTDIGQPITGRVAAVGVIVGKNLWGDKFKVAILGLDNITAAASNASGAVPGTTTVPAIPVPSITFDSAGQAIASVVGDAKTVNIRYLVRNDRAPTVAEVRATSNVAGNNIVNAASGVYVTIIPRPGTGMGYIGALAYNAAGDESPLGATSATRAPDTPPSLQLVPSLTNNQLDDTTAAPSIVASASNLPAVYTWAIRNGYSKGQYGATPIYSGSNASNPLTFTQAVTPAAKLSKWYQLDIVVGADHYYAETQIQGFLTFVNPSGAPVAGTAWSDGGGVARTSDPTGNTLTAGVTDNGARNVNKFFAKGLSGNPDALTSVPDDLSYAKTITSRVSSGKPLIDFSESIHLNKNAGNIARSSGDATAVSTIVQSIDNSGNAASTMLDSGSRGINRFYAKGLSGNPDTADSIGDGLSTGVTSFAQRTGGGKANVALNTSNRLVTGVDDSADVAGIVASLVGRSQGTGVFTENWESGGTDVWGAVNGSSASILAVASGGGYGKNRLHVTGATVWLAYQRAIPFDPSKLYRVRFRIACTFFGGQANGGAFFAGVAGLSAGGANLNAISGANSYNNSFYAAANGAVFPYNGGAVNVIDGWVKGINPNTGTIANGLGTPTAPTALYQGTAYFQPMCVLNYGGSSTTCEFYIDSIEITEYDDDASARTYNNFSGIGTVAPGVSQYDSSGTRPMMRGYQVNNYQHGDTVTFPTPYANTPKVRISGGIKHEPRSLWGTNGGTAAVSTTLPQIEDFSLDSISKTGGVMRARLRQPGTTVGASDTWGGTTSVSAVGAVTSDRAPTAVANDGTYHATGTLAATVVYDMSLGGLQSESATFALDVDILNNGTWTEVATQTVTASSTGGNYTHSVASSLSCTRSDVTTSSQFRIRAKAESGTGGSFTGTASALTYNTATGDKYANATYDTGVSVALETWEGDNAV